MDLTVSGLGRGASNASHRDMLARFAHHPIRSRGCSASRVERNPWWGGCASPILLQAYPHCQRALGKLESSVNLDAASSPIRITSRSDLPTLDTRKTLLVASVRKDAQVEPRRAPAAARADELGLKNIKASPRCLSVEAPADYWNERGYSKYDEL